MIDREAVKPLAKMLALAYVAYNNGTTFETAKRLYSSQPVGDFWYGMAQYLIDRRIEVHEN